MTVARPRRTRTRTARKSEAAVRAAIVLVAAALAAFTPSVEIGADATTFATVDAPADAPSGEFAVPAVGASFDYLQGMEPADAVAASTADVVGIDGENATAADVAALHARGAYAVCYVNAGGWEPYRSDSDQFPADLLGAVMDGWPDERWMDIRRREELLALMEPRVADCAAKGFDAVDFDNVHAYTEGSGFPLTAADQLAFNRGLADLVHAAGMAAVLKNDVFQLADLVTDFDLAINEECLQYDECALYEPFVAAGKPVFNVEYVEVPDQCALAADAGISSTFARLDLTAPGVACP